MALRRQRIGYGTEVRHHTRYQAIALCLCSLDALDYIVYAISGQKSHDSPPLNNPNGIGVREAHHCTRLGNKQRI
jgi:hypothetical protein